MEGSKVSVLKTSVEMGWDILQISLQKEKNERIENRRKRIYEKFKGKNSKINEEKIEQEKIEKEKIKQKEEEKETFILEISKTINNLIEELKQFINLKKEEFSKIKLNTKQFDSFQLKIDSNQEEVNKNNLNINSTENKEEKLQEQFDILSKNDEKYSQKLQKVFLDDLEIMENKSQELKMQLQNKLYKLLKTQTKEKNYKIQNQIEKLVEVEKSFHQTKFQEISLSSWDLIEEYEEQIEKSNELRRDFDLKIQKLELEIENQKMENQTKLVKLNYNLEILKERELENQEVIKQQRTTISEKREILNNLKKKFDEKKKAFEQENITLTEELKQIQNNFENLRKSFEKLVENENNQFVLNVEMQKKRILEQVNNIFQFDEIIHKNFLGLNWEKPNLLEKINEIFDSISNENFDLKKLFWKQIEKPIEKTNMKVWELFEKQLKKHLKILIERKELSEEVILLNKNMKN
ncbi:dynein regulatory complex protein [Anaeramoeba ignava]|uniref:Dynein regulatory complex protein n=1 Tax=Anaeramoeba ignava TaxID=1746090 RepID=A0A9Q0LXP0_ANAIG|nr:dynein regulatory complex protein [Anaeramoeba ignava]